MEQMFRDVKMDIISGSVEEKRQVDYLLYYLLEGTCRVYVEGAPYDFRRDDFLVINTNQRHRIENEEGNMLAVITISYAELCQKTREDVIHFECNTTNDYGYRYTELRQSIQNMLQDYAESSGELSYRSFGLAYLVVDTLLRHFRIHSGRVEAEGKWSTDHRLYAILTYIHANFDHSISLTEVAKESYMSVSSLSRFFTRQMGQSFVEYVRDYRMRKVEEQLRNTDIPITKIAINCGFSNPSVLGSEFQKIHHMTPSQYRRENKAERPEQRMEAAPMRHFRQLMHFQEKGNPKQEDEKRQIVIKAGQGTPFQLWPERILSAGHAYILEKAIMQKHILIFKDMMGVDYIRIWGLTSGQMIMWDRSKNRYNFTRLDYVLDFCVENQMKLYLDLGQREETIVTSENKTLYRRDDSLEFENKKAWEEYLEQLMQHLVERYDRENVENWIFELSFFLIIRPYYMDERYSARQVWDRSYEIIRNYAPSARIVGPGIPLLEDGVLQDYIKSFLSTEHQPDLFSIFLFPYKSKGNSKEFQRSSDRDFIKNGIETFQKILTSVGYQGEILLSDWNYSLANRSYLQDSCFRGAWLLKNYLQNFESVHTMGMFHGSDILNMYYDSEAILTGSGGLISVDGILKPAGFAFHFLANMGNSLLEKGEDYLITADPHGRIRILCFNYKPLSTNYYFFQEDSYNPQELSSLYQNQEKKEFSFCIENLENDESYQIRHFYVNEEQGSVLNEWIKLGCEKQLNARDLEYLQQITVPGLALERRTAIDGTLRLDLQLLPHEMRLVTIEKK